MNEEDYLVHYGVLGMRWGHRKVNSSSNGSGRAKKGSIASKYSGKTKKTRKTNIKKLSDEELRSKIRRLEMEKRYRDLKKDEVSEGRKLVGEILRGAAVSLGTQTLVSLGKTAIRETTGYQVSGGGKKRK